MRQRTFLALALVAAGLLLACSAALSADHSVRRIGIDDLRARLGRSDLTVIDVRSSYAWVLSNDKIPGAVRRDPHNLDWIDRLPPDGTYVLYCS